MVKKDADRTPAWQAKNSPYYILQRYSRWHRVDVIAHSGEFERTYTRKVTHGVTTGNQKQIDDTLEVKVSAEGGFDIKGISAKMKNEVGRTLKVSTTKSIGESQSEERMDRKGPRG